MEYTLICLLQFFFLSLPFNFVPISTSHRMEIMKQWIAIEFEMSKWVMRYIPCGCTDKVPSTWNVCATKEKKKKNRKFIIKCEKKVSALTSIQKNKHSNINKCQLEFSMWYQFSEKDWAKDEGEVASVILNVAGKGKHECMTLFIDSHATAHSYIGDLWFCFPLSEM